MKTKSIYRLARIFLALTATVPFNAMATDMNDSGSTQRACASDTHEESPRALWQHWANLWNGDYTEGRIISADFHLHAAMLDGSSDAAIRGPDGLIRWIHQARAPYRDMRFTTQVGPLVSGEYIVGRWIATGAYQGGVPGAKAEPGAVVTFAGTDILRVCGGKIVEYWVTSDTTSMLAQLKVF